MRQTGIAAVGAVRWGTHFCQLYETSQDLVDLLVPYFREGLVANEFCLWVTSAPLGVEEATAALREAVPDLDARLAGGQIEILDHREWSSRSGKLTAGEVLGGWVDRLEAARRLGFEGLRLTGNASWLDSGGWQNFTRQEQAVDAVVGQHHILALCTCSLDRCRATEVIDVLANHEFALVKRASRWERIETSTHRLAEEKVRRRNAVLDGINRIFREALTCESEEQLGRACLRAAEELTQSPFGFIAEVDALGQLREVAMSEPGWAACRTEHRVSHGEAPAGLGRRGVHARVLVDGRGLFTNSPASHPDSVGVPEGHPAMEAFLGAPLLHGGKVVGLVGLANRRGGYGAEELEALEALAPAIVHALMHHRAERALRDSENQYRSIVETAQEGILIGAPDGRVLFVNQKMADLLGYAREDLVGRAGLDLLADPDEGTILINRAALQAGGLVRSELKLRRKDGSPLWTLVNASPLRDGAGQHVGNLAMHTDISERKRAEQALREARDQLEGRVLERTAELDRANRALGEEVAERRRAEERVRAERQRLYDVLETLPVYVVLLAADYHVPFANRFFRERFGESQGRRCFEYLFERAEPCENCESYKALRTGAPHHWQWTGPDGRDYEIHDFPFKDSDGSTLVMEMGIDVTERNQAERALRRHQEQLEGLVRERTSALEERNARLVGEIAERQRAEEALRQAQGERERSLAQLQAVLDHLTEGLVVADTDGRLFHWNPAAVAMHGFSSADECRRRLADFAETFELSTVEDGVLPLERWPLARILRGETLRNWEVVLRHRHDPGWRRVFSYGGTLARGQDGQPLLAVVSVTDVTERKLAQAALQTAHDTLEQRVQERTEELRQANQTLRMISDCNQALVRATTEQDLVQEICHTIHDRGQYRMAWVGYAEHGASKLVRPVAARGFEGGYLERARITWADEDLGRGPTGTCIRTGQVCFGRDFLVDPELAPWRDLAQAVGFRSSIALPLVAEGQAFGALTIYADDVGVFDEAQARLLTELADDLAFGIVALRSRLERDHARQVAEERARQLATLANELGRVEQRERRRLARVLHDHLQQLLVGAKYDLATLEGRLRRKAEHDDVRRVTGILDDALEAARTLTAELSPPVLHEKGLVDALDWLGRQMKKKYSLGVEVRADRRAEPADEPVRLFLFDAVRELLFNVVKHAGVSRAKVTLTRLGSREVQVVVADGGAGFDAARLEAAERAGGGFGLFSIRERLRGLGGLLKVESRPGEGSRFTLVAPAGAPRAAEATPSDAAAAPDASAKGRRAHPGRGAVRRFRVLLADDHAVMRAGLARLLNEQADIEVVGEASDGQEAVDLARRLRPDVVLMDVSMPHVSGLEATRLLVRELPEVRVIGLSMHESIGMAEAMREAGAVEYLTKSGRPTRIVAAVRDHLVAGAAQSAPGAAKAGRSPERGQTAAPGRRASARAAKTPGPRRGSRAK